MTSTCQGLLAVSRRVGPDPFRWRSCGRPAASTSSPRSRARPSPRLLEKPGETSYRVSVAGGLVGIGGYDAPGGSDNGSINGIKALPLHIFPRAGAGNSLNIDPVTGRLR